jgi:adenylate kinase family enzyme
VPLLGPDDPLGRRPRRVLVAGGSGAGKSTLADRIGATLDVPHVEIDGLFHGPGWTQRPTFEADVRRLTAEPAWVTEWQYTAVRRLLVERAELLVWLDLPRALVMRQVVLRTVRRRLTRRELWNGNVEPPLHTVLTRRDHIVRWAWRTHRASADRVARLVPERPDLVVVRLRSRAEVARWSGGPLTAARALPDLT